MNSTERLKKDSKSITNKFKFDGTMFGRQVRFTNVKLHQERPDFYPELGTIGTVVPVDKFRSFSDDVEFLIAWPIGSTSMNDVWQCSEDCLELIDDVIDYTPEEYGSIIAMRLFIDRDHIPYATLAFAYGGTITVQWDIVANRKKFEKGINAYTLIYDERVGNTTFIDNIRAKR